MSSLINMNVLPIVLLFVGGVVLTVGDVVMKKWVNQSGWHLYFAGLMIYFVGLNFLAYSFKYKNIGVASLIFVLFNIVTLCFVSWVYFKETLSLLQILGIVIGLISVVILELA